MSNNPIILVCSVDDGYARHLGSMLVSLFKNKLPETEIEVFVINKSISKINRSRLTNISKRFGFRLEYLPIDDKMYNDFQSMEQNRVTYYRLAIPELLCHIYDKVLYLDCDIIIRKDLYELWNVDISRYYLAAIIDWCLPITDARPPYYFNGGIMLMNIKKIREERIIPKILDYLKDNITTFWDQDGINAIIKDKYLELPRTFNYIVSRHDSRCKTKLADPSIVHFAGRNRPWLCYHSHPYRYAFYKYLLLTEWRSTIMTDIKIMLRIKYDQIKYAIDKSFRKIKGYFETVIEYIRQESNHLRRSILDNINSLLRILSRCRYSHMKYSYLGKHPMLWNLLKNIKKPIVRFLSPPTKRILYALHKLIPKYDIPAYSGRRGRMLFIDCSHTYLFGNNTGIQRVVRNIVNSLDHTEHNSIRAVPVAFLKGGYMEIDSISKTKHPFIEYLRKVKRLMLSNTIVNILAPEDKVRDENGESITHKAKIRVMNLIYFFASLRHFSNKKIAMKSGDIILIVDNFWDENIYKRLVDAKDQGIEIGFLLHDLFPLEDHLFESGLGHVFRKNIDLLISISSFCITVSETIKRDLESYIHITKQRKDLPILSNFHGRDMDNYGDETSIRDEVKTLFVEKRELNPYIAVSTIEPRKNYAYLLDAFDELWSKGCEPRICIIGKVGWNSHSLIRRLKDHDQLNRRLFVFHDINDAELRFIYNRAKALITPSTMEGFGLPIIESLSNGCPVFASDIPIYREVGSRYCAYFDLNDPNDLVKRIEDFEKGKDITDISNFKWPTWKESTEQLISKIEKIIK